MSRPRPVPIALEYAAPAVFFVGEYRTRNAGSIIFALFGSLLSIVVVLLFMRGAIDRTAAGLALLLSLPITAWAGYLAGSKQTWVVRVTADGVELQQKVWPWARVERFGGMRDGEGVHLYAKMKDNAAGPNLSTTPPLTGDEFDRLRVELEHFFSTRGIAVTVDRQIQAIE